MSAHKTTCAIIVNGNNDILLIKRGREPYKDYWALVSGVGESKKGLSPEKAILGEVEWDLGTTLLNSTRLFSISVKNNEFTDEIIVFRGNIDESKIKMRPGFSENFKWVSPIEISGLPNLAFEHSEIIQQYLEE